MIEITMVPLHLLYVHPLNTRSEPPPAEIELLADSIRSAGLMQNLMGFKDPEGGFADATDLQSLRIGIVAGGRRLRALQMLHGTDSSTEIPVQITGEAITAAEWAGAENTARAALNPADEVRAYRAMRQQGAAPATIARAFAVRERHVLGRLKLALLSDPVLDALRHGKISIEQAEALTVAPSDEAAEQLLPRIIESTTQWHRMSPDQIRRTLRPDAVPATDRRAVFVGIETYSDRGGRIQSDLFSDSTVLLDPALLDQLFTEALDTERARVAAEGWAQVITFTEAYPDYDAVNKIVTQRLAPTPVDLPEADADELAELQARSESEELTTAELARMDELDRRAAGDFSDDDRANGIAVLYVNARGQLIFAGAWRQRTESGEGDSEAGSEGETITAKPDGLPQNLRDDLNTILTLALQTALLDKPELVLDLLAITLTADIWPWHRPLAINPAQQNLTPSKPDETTIDARLADAVASDDRTGMTDLLIQHLDEMQAAGRKARNASITAALTRTMHTAATDFGKALAARLGVNARKVWHPTADNYFKRLPAGMLDAIWDDLLPDHDAEAIRFRALKKADKAKELHQLFHSADYREALGLSRDQNARIDAWLPPELQLPKIEAPATEAAYG